MTPNVVVDIGNSRMKWGLCEDGRVIMMESLLHDDPVGWKRLAEEWEVVSAGRWAVAGVAPAAMLRFTEWLVARDSAVLTLTSKLFTSGGPMRLVTTVEEPDRVGVDRLLASLAAWTRTPVGISAVAISVGTAMTVDFVKPGGTHVGGAILPGPELMARSLHDYTAKLPLVSPDPVLPIEGWGTNTEDAIQVGIASAIRGAADTLVWNWAERTSESLWVFATGGNADYLRKFEFTAELGSFVIDPTLILEGIRIAAEALP